MTDASDTLNTDRLPRRQHDRWRAAAAMHDQRPRSGRHRAEGTAGEDELSDGQLTAIVRHLSGETF